MRLTIKALRWIITLLWIVALTLPISVAFSLIKLVEGKNLGIQKPTFTFSNGNISVNIPVYVNNTGFYDISEVNVETSIGKADIIITATSSSLPNIPVGQTVNTSCGFTVSLGEIFQKDSTLLTEDTDLSMNMALRFKVAYAITFNIAHNFSIKWGAPFHNLTYVLAYNDTTHVFSFFISFNNHAFFSISGPLTVELWNSNNIKIGKTLLYLDVPFGGTFQESIDVHVDPSVVTHRVLIRLFFDELNILETEWTLS